MKTPEDKIDGGETMAEMFEGFAEQIMPDVAKNGPQYADMKGAFFAGGLCLFNWFMVQLEEGSEVTDTDLQRVSKMNIELHSFFTEGIVQ
jgi:hypothetical protein